MAIEQEKTREGLNKLASLLELRKNKPERSLVKQHEEGGKPQIEDMRCDICNGLLIEGERGELFCKECGVLQEGVILEGNVGSGMNISGVISTPGRGGLPITPGEGQITLGTKAPKGLKSLQTGMVLKEKTQLEKLSVDLYNYLKELGNKLHIPDIALKTAKKYYLSYNKEFYVPSVKLYITAALYLTVNMTDNIGTPQQYQRDIKDFANASGYTKKQIFKAYKNIKSIVIPYHQKENVMPTSPRAIVPILIQKILSKEKIQKNPFIITEILELIRNSEIYMDENKIYRQARGIVATAFYLILYAKYRIVEKEKIIEGLEVSQTTINNNATWMTTLVNNIRNDVKQERKQKKIQIKYKQIKYNKQKQTKRKTQFGTQTQKRKIKKTATKKQTNKIFESIINISGIKGIKPLKIFSK